MRDISWLGSFGFLSPRQVSSSGNGLLNNLIAYWKLNEAAGANDALDAHTNGLTMTQALNPGSAAGILGTSRTFNGTTNQKFSRTDEALLSTGDVDFTISAWTYITDLSTMRAIISRWTVSGNHREYVLAYNYNDHVTNNRFSFWVSSNGSAYTTIDANTFGAPSINTWYHVIGWHDAGNNLLGISVNNVADTATYSSGVYDATSLTEIGLINTALWRTSGRIDEIGFWKSAAGGGGVLTAAQRTALYNSGAGLAYENFTT